MASFESEIQQATQRLREFSQEADRASRGTRQREQETEQRSALARIGSVLGGGIGGLTPAANTFGATGSFEDAADVASGSLVEAVLRTTLGGLAGGVLGITKDVAARIGARGETMGLLDDLARYNVPISDEFLQKVIDTKVAQHERIEELRGRVTAKTAYTPVDAAIGTLGEGAFTKLSDAIVRLIDFLESWDY